MFRHGGPNPKLAAGRLVISAHDKVRTISALKHAIWFPAADGVIKQSNPSDLQSGNNVPLIYGFGMLSQGGGSNDRSHGRSLTVNGID